MSQHLGDRAAAYVDGVLDAAEAARARTHLETCEPCREQVAAQERVRELLRSTGPIPRVPSSDLMAVLSSMPNDGPPQRAAQGHRRRAVTVRRAAVSTVAVSATMLATAWVVGGQAAAAGPPAVPPASLLAQHSATAGELPFWGARSEVTTTAAAATKVAGRDQARDGLATWMTKDPALILKRAAQASSTLSFKAVEQVTTYDGSTSVTQVAQVSHLSGQGTSTRSVDGGDDAFQPQVVGPASSSLEAVELLQRTYRVRAEGADLVAGRRVDRLAVFTPDGTLVARFWIDRQSGLPLARESQRDGRMSVANRMTAMSLADRTQMPDHLPIATSAVWGEAVGIPAAKALEVLEADGWVCPDQLGAAIGMQAFDVLLADGDASGSQGPVLHIIYTDGLRSVSVFQQHATLSAQRLVGFRSAEVGGAEVYRKDTDPSEVTWVADGTVFTVVGDVADPVLDTVVAALPHDEVGVGSRTGRGLARVGSWFDPFG